MLLLYFHGHCHLTIELMSQFPGFLCFPSSLRQFLDDETLFFTRRQGRIREDWLEIKVAYERSLHNQNDVPLNDLIICNKQSFVSNVPV